MKNRTLIVDGEQCGQGNMFILHLILFAPLFEESGLV
jgi:hypothetical protein